jgi:penicillin-binding protein 1A
MQQAMKGKTVGNFRLPPEDAKFLLVNGEREAFRNGTQPKAPGEAAAGPQPYTSLAPDGVAPGAPIAGGAIQPALPPRPPPKTAARPPPDVSGLY